MAHCSRGQKVLKNAKPFCECKKCNDKKCPNVLHNLGVTLEDNGVILENKPSVKVKTELRKCSKPKKVDSMSSGRTNAVKSDRMPSLLGILDPSRACNCAVVAKALRTDVHKHIGTLLNRCHTDEGASQSNDVHKHIGTPLDHCRTDKDASRSNDPDHLIDTTTPTAGASPPKDADPPVTSDSSALQSQVGTNAA